MKSIDFVIILATMAHPNKWTVVFGPLKNAFKRVHFLDKFMNDVTLTSTQALRFAFCKSPIYDN